MKKKIRIKITRELLRVEAKREAPHIHSYGWRPSKRDLAQLRRSTRDALAYRTYARAWHWAGFKVAMIRKLAGRASCNNTARALAANARTGNFSGGTNEATTMANDVTIVNDGWSDAAAEVTERVLRGTLLKFGDGNWSRGKEGVVVEKGSTLAAIGTAAAWVKWAGGKPVEHRMRQNGKPLPDREELGDLDQTKWEIGPDGKTPRDPWQSTRFVYLVDPDTAEAFTFSTSSWGGREAVINLGDSIARMRCAHPNATPIVALEAGPMVTRYGRKSKPIFKVVGWKSVGGEAQELLTSDAAESPL
jgi:hypothetical protein